MDIAIISAVSALAGSVFGGVTSGVTTWISQRSQTRFGHRLNQRTERSELYREFITTASAVAGKALLNSEPEIQDFVLLYSMLSRMRVLSSAEVIASAEAAVETIIDTFFAPNKTVAELHALIKGGEAIDPLRHFSETTRDELNQLR
jgi:hypothetical protein